MLRRLVIACLSLLAAWTAAVPPASAQPRMRAPTISLFDGTTLGGWQTRGEGQWRAENGAITGAASPGAPPAALWLERRYEDVILTFTYRCADCDAGVLLRTAPLSAASAPARTRALHASLGAADARQAFDVTLDDGGRIIARELVQKFEGRSRAIANLQFDIIPQADGWIRVSLLLRGDIVAGNPPNGPPPNETPAGAARPGGGNFGAIVLRVSRGQAQFKDLTLVDLTRPITGLEPAQTSPQFRRVTLTDRFYAEGIAAGDIDRDGRVDIVSGPLAYLGPDFQRAIEIYPPETFNATSRAQHGAYTDSFMTYVHDFDRDGWNDVLKVNFNGAFLYVNPRGESRHWAEHKVVDDTSSETTQLADLDRSGQVSLIYSTGRDPDRVISIATPGADATRPWTVRAVSTRGAWGGHTMGYGDINGDGRLDIVHGAGWWEQPPAAEAQRPWRHHATTFGRGDDPFVRGADIHVDDVDGDGLPDVITSMFAHGPGLMWYAQRRGADGAIGWTPHTIMDAPEASPAERAAWEETDTRVAFTELHAIALADMNGDGVQDIVTGKRWFSHGIEYRENDLDAPAVLYWFEVARQRDGRVRFIPHLIDNFVGIGTQIAVIDVDDDERPDVLTAQRRGAYAFLNAVPRASARGPVRARADVR